jgi:hypothetical protein
MKNQKSGGIPRSIYGNSLFLAQGIHCPLCVLYVRLKIPLGIGGVHLPVLFGDVYTHFMDFVNRIGVRWRLLVHGSFLLIQ